jgi:leucyl aminopeptidase
VDENYFTDPSLIERNPMKQHSRTSICALVLLTLVQASALLADKPAEEPRIIISTDSKVAAVLQKELQISPILGKKTFSPDIALLSVKPSQLTTISALIHEQFHRCGGFMVEQNERSLAELSAPPQAFHAHSRGKDLYAIDQQELVKKLSSHVSEGALVTTIKTLSAYPNRYYRSTHGQSSQSWVKDQWAELTKNIPAASVALVTHSAFAQPSVVLTWKGTKADSEVVILGGHGDSIAGFMSGNDNKAPGADDNASGIATITEVIRLLATNNFQPQRTLHFISYAAEEVGLRGSDDLARQYRQKNVNVLGVMQLDMVNFSDNRHDIVLITDNTDSAQNVFVKNLLATYLPQLTIGENPCGYACSDHASWTRQGYPASFPFEAAMEEYNGSIHTARDTIDKSENGARHALPFVTLAAAFVVEMGML